MTVLHQAEDVADEPEEEVSLHIAPEAAGWGHFLSQTV